MKKLEQSMEPRNVERLATESPRFGGTEIRRTNRGELTYCMFGDQRSTFTGLHEEELTRGLLVACSSTWL